MQQELIHHLFLKNWFIANLKSDVEILDIDKLKNVPSGLSSLKSKIDKLDIGKLETKLDDLKKKVKAISTKGLTQDLINKISIPKGSKSFFI